MKSHFYAFWYSGAYGMGERYLLEFLNSYGAYERIEVTGIGNIESEIESDSTYQIYDESIDDYIEARERQSARDKLQVESGIDIENRS